ncbi:hypothetical protein LOTGIDRAFT_231922 [Lottia gigantea]|uniref:BHLH domain-containing protein n=1 Tax=Lottia gigantea TaxID=225164 RepID=V4ALR8_LOTGI|nr:hypothetical protein LOTGIDRAFT_231922 [Lottia gigantea]ESO95705.1 hypothetical protein LOTGIDRAFT_231922 [Lottia gigantea]
MMALTSNQIQQIAEPTNNYGTNNMNDNNNSCFWKRPKEDTDERSFNFNIKPEDMEFHRSRKTSKQQRDPMSHRIIEKRRRDRMNNCLSDLSKLIPHGYIKQVNINTRNRDIQDLSCCYLFMNIQDLSCCYLFMNIQDLLLFINRHTGSEMLLFIYEYTGSAVIYL